MLLVFLGRQLPVVKMNKDFKNIETYLLSIISFFLGTFIILFSFFLSKSILSSFQEPILGEYDESGILIIMLFAGIIYEGIFFFWQMRLRNNFIHKNIRKHFQLSFIVLLGILPAANFLLHLFIEKILGFDSPNTTKIGILFFKFILFPFTGEF